MGGLDQICSLCGLRAELDRESLAIHPLTRRAAENLSFDPLHLIASGSMLAVVPERHAQEALSALAAAGIEAAVAGRMGGKLGAPLPEPAEELWRLLKMEKKDAR